MNDGRPKVQSSGNPDQAELVVVGEYPGAEEERTGQSFIGPSGQLQRTELRARGWSDGRVYFGNVIKCRPKKRDGESEFPDAELLSIARRCSQYLQAELAQVPSTAVVIGAGNLPLQVFLNRRGILSERGILHRLPDGRRFFPTINPAYVLYGHEDHLPKQDGLALLRGDLRRLRHVLTRGGSPAVQARLLRTLADVRGAVTDLCQQPRSFFDLETVALSPWGGPRDPSGILAIGIAAQPGEVVGIPIGHRDAPMPWRDVWPEVCRYFASAGAKGALHGQHDLHWVRWAGADVVNYAYDDMMAAVIFSTQAGGRGARSSLTRLAADWLWEIEYPWWQVDKTRMADYPLETVVGVAMTDAEWELRIHDRMLERMRATQRSS